MKRKLLPPSLGKTLLAVPAAALMLGAAHGAQIGINFQTDWTPYNYSSYTTGFAVTGTAFDVSAANWYNMAPSKWDGATATNQTIATADGSLAISWSCANAWGSGIGNIAAPTDPGVVVPGNDEVTWSYLDDSASGYSVTIAGLRGLGDYSLYVIAATDGGSGFSDVNLQTNLVFSEALNYTNDPSQVILYGGAAAGTSTVSTVYATLNGNDTITLRGAARAGSSRSTCAGIILNYTPANNPPLIELNPQSPAGNIFPGGSFELHSLASGAATLHYQWRQNGTDLPGANYPGYTNTSAVVGDTGDYDVVVTNSFGSVTSTVAQVSVQSITTPTIIQSPLSQNLYVGYPVTFSVVATGGQLTYQWMSNGVTVPGANGSSFSIPSITAANAGTYTVEVSNSVGPTASSSATLEVKVPAAGTYEAVVAQTKPLLWFRDSETIVPLVVTGTATNSGSTGPAEDGVAKYYTTFQQPGALEGDANKSVSFNGSQAIDVPFDAALNTVSFTVELWAKPTTVDGGGAQSPLYNRGAAAGDGWLFWANNATTSWQFRTYESTVRTTINSTAPALPGVWTHLVGVYDGTTVHFYVNGVEQGSGIAANYIPNTSIPLRMGGAGNDTGATSANMWKGGVDEVALYSSVLTPAEILSHYQNGTNAARTTPYATLVQASAPVGYWRLNDPAGPVPPTPANSGTLGDTWNGAYNGDIEPGVAGPLPPTFPGFESTNHSVSMTNGFTSAPIVTNLNVNTVTVTCWMNRPDTFTTGDLAWPAWLGGGGMHLNLTTSPSPGELRYHWNGNNWGWGSGLFVPANVWTFCAMVIEPTKATFYMSSGSNLLSSVDNVPHAPMIVTSPPGFGGNQPGRGDRNYIGLLDESTVYDRALTQSEITTMFLVGSGTPFLLDIVPGGVIEDTKPVGTLHDGGNYLTTWLASSTDPASVTRTGVEVFATTNNSQITVPASADFDSTTGTFTFWLKADAPIPGPGNEGAMIMDRRAADGVVIVLNDAGNIFVQCAGGANSLAVGYLPDGFWHNVAVTYDQSASGSVAIYIDGVLNGSSPNTAAWSWPTAQPVELGRSHDGYWKRYDGQLDDFRIYSRVLTDPEIADVASTGALVDTAALKLRFNFDTSGIGQSVTWPFGTLLSSPTLDPGAVWTPVPGATPPTYPFLPKDEAKFFRATP
jgi:Concanavalin A-like lectin/glucanases superfamily/Immunoglobulin domain